MLEKYTAKSKTELAEDLARRDQRKKNERAREKAEGGKVVRMGTGLATGLLTGIVYTLQPKVEKFLGPVGGDAVLALAGGAGALAMSGTAADVSEGVGQAGLVGAGRDMGAYLAGLFSK